MKKRRGHYTVSEGLDGIGKGVVESAIKHHINPKGGILPFAVDFNGFLCDFEKEPMDITGQTVFVSEPSYVGIGKAIRDEIIAKNGRNYSAKSQAQAYSLDREVLLKRCILPILNSGNHVFSSRNLASSLCYQALAAKRETGLEESVEETRNYILSLPGNWFALSHAPDLMIISTIKDPAELISRLDRRKEKRDDCIFENLSFQTDLKPFYEDRSLRDLFEGAGTKIAYLDAGISIESTREQAVEIYKDFYENGGLIKPRYQNP